MTQDLRKLEVRAGSLTPAQRIDALADRQVFIALSPDGRGMTVSGDPVRIGLARFAMDFHREDIRTEMLEYLRAHRQQFPARDPMQVPNAPTPHAEGAR